ncbi:MAG: MFS transporter [Spirochaetales bacterium]|nr:MFS transporter [Spirochaetales bacterium]
MIQKIKKIIREYPKVFWILAGSSFIDALGKTILFPYFTLYITKKFQVGMTEAGVLLAIFSVMGMAGSMAGGALTDKAGRKIMMLFGLVLSALSSLAMGFIERLSVFYIVAFFVGFLSDLGHPARQAMIADILPENKRAEGFGVFRVIHNLAWIVGPSIGGLMAARSYMTLFITDAVLSSLTALIILKSIAETKPKSPEHERTPGFLKTLAGYGEVVKNRLFISFLGVVIFMVLVYQQLYSTLSVYMRDIHGIPPAGYGMLMSLNAFLVVVFQFWVSRKVSGRNPFLMMTLGTVCYFIGYTSIGFIRGYGLFLAATAVITMGEMITVPVHQALVARLAPEDMRGRYMAISDLSYAIPSAVGPWAAGLVMDNYNPNYVWYICGFISILAIIGFLGLFTYTRRTKILGQEENPSS